MRMFGQQLISERSSLGRSIRLLLVGFILVALWHVSQHDVQADLDANNSGHCNLCRLNHMPSAGGGAQVVFAAILVHAPPLLPVAVPLFRSKSYLPRLARGPPSF